MSRLVPVEYVTVDRSVRTPPVVTLIHIAVKGQVHSWKSEKKAPMGLVRRKENRAYLTEPGMWSVVVNSGERLRAS